MNVDAISNSNSHRNLSQTARNWVYPGAEVLERKCLIFFVCVGAEAIQLPRVLCSEGVSLNGNFSRLLVFLSICFRMLAFGSISIITTDPPTRVYIVPASAVASPFLWDISNSRTVTLLCLHLRSTASLYGTHISYFSAAHWQNFSNRKKRQKTKCFSCTQL